MDVDIKTNPLMIVILESSIKYEKGFLPEPVSIIKKDISKIVDILQIGIMSGFTIVVMIACSSSHDFINRNTENIKNIFSTIIPDLDYFCWINFSNFFNLNG